MDPNAKWSKNPKTNFDRKWSHTGKPGQLQFWSCLVSCSHCMPPGFEASKWHFTGETRAVTKTIRWSTNLTKPANSKTELVLFEVERWFSNLMSVQQSQTLGTREYRICVDRIERRRLPSDCPRNSVRRESIFGISPSRRAYQMMRAWGPARDRSEKGP